MSLWCTHTEVFRGDYCCCQCTVNFTPRNSEFNSRGVFAGTHTHTQKNALKVARNDIWCCHAMVLYYLAGFVGRSYIKCCLHGRNCFCRSHFSRGSADLYTFKFLEIARHYIAAHCIRNIFRRLSYTQQVVCEFQCDSTVSGSFVIWGSFHISTHKNKNKNSNAQDQQSDHEIRHGIHSGIHQP